MRIVKEFIMRTVAGETILVPTGAAAEEFNGMLTLTETAKVIWENLEKVDSLDEMVHVLTEQFEVDQETAKQDTAALVSELLRIGFIECTKEDRTW
ncbi:MAG: PqqD family protein [Sellimonas sp.]|uniref:PqqD family protein n=1 Tax=Sellimonas sp. TaxID=2021466 RepID=UPI00399F653B